MGGDRNHGVGRGRNVDYIGKVTISSGSRMAKAFLCRTNQGKSIGSYRCLLAMPELAELPPPGTVRGKTFVSVSLCVSGRHELFPRSSSLGNPLRTSDPIYFRDVRKFARFHTA